MLRSAKTAAWGGLNRFAVDEQSWIVRVMRSRSPLADRDQACCGAMKSDFVQKCCNPSKPKDTAFKQNRFLALGFNPNSRLIAPLVSQPISQPISRRALGWDWVLDRSPELPSHQYPPTVRDAKRSELEPHQRQRLTSPGSQTVNRAPPG
jgi:hypothetical protein